MPYHWTTVPSSPPQERRNAVAEICRRHGGRLCENQIFYGAGSDRAQALIQADDEAKLDAILDELGALDRLGLVDADEKAHGKHPPASGRA